MYDDYTIEYHLNPGGWIKGSYAYRGKFEGEPVRPTDCIITAFQRNYQSSGHSPEKVTRTESWRSAGAGAKSLEELAVQFPLPA
jgi:hypothetical protein